ncbi:MAG: monovalent cation/H(+) antiporter subunit G [Pseudomonadota bacterium]|jgi:multicomponent K+:H+ antiporter subunit G|uniref:Potassium:proton antiporter n=1 Tax=Brevundimonas vesicularis TaxID=41276 RepID=A0A1Z3UC28_BREVE|nr:MULTISPECIES: monovalent cation/H(+) antiporter subunit G [Brevundimonas]ASE40534.1 potassium:proton antiporter [Brevundimonas vesicularis]KQR61418.1 potassium:proton antiporter [Brevundimonas sp. Leaf168]NSX32573.1 cation:proton antiporter [Brevundimonas vesicularis]
MTQADVPAWAAIIVVALAVIGSALSLLGAVGLVRLKTFYERVHAPTLGATLGMALVLLASIVWFTTVERRFMPREILIGLFLTVTTPVTLILLARAALFRDRTDRVKDTPRKG